MFSFQGILSDIRIKEKWAFPCDILYRITASDFHYTYNVLSEK